MLPKNIFKRHTHIGIDLDDTLANTLSWFLEVAHQMGKLMNYSSIEEIHNYNIVSDPSSHISEMEVEAIWNTYWSNPSYPYTDIFAYKTLRALISTNTQCAIITARNMNDIRKFEQTKTIIHRDFPFLWEEIYFINHYNGEKGKKSKTCKELGISLLIDDTFDNVKDMIDNGLSAILLEKPWNRDIPFSHENLYRVKNWEEIYAIL